MNQSNIQGSHQPEVVKKVDLTGRDRFFSNLLHSWGGYLIVFVAGFLSPRLIDRNLGQVELGIWDFSWSFVGYMKLSMLGIGSSINRYVANYRASGDTDRLNMTVSTVACLQTGIAVFILLMSVFFCWLTPLLLDGYTDKHIAVACWTVMILGASLAVNMAFDTSRGILTGWHRWDVHNLIESASNTFELVGMVSVLLLGGGLRSLGMIVLATALLSGLCRVVLVRKICEDLYVTPNLFRWNIMTELIRFGLKTLALRSPLLILVQTINIFIATNLGLASLAVFSRSVALVRHVEGFIGKFAYILAPTAGSLQGMGKEEELRLFFLEKTRYGIAFASPFLFFLIFDGDLILRLWMGKHYVHGQLLAILALGYFLPTSQNSVSEILKGLNAHGKVGLFCFGLSCSGFIIGLVLLNYIGWTLNGAAILLAISLMVGLGFAPPIYACYKLKLSYLQYWRVSFLPPLLCNIIFIICLISGRWLFPDNLFAAISSGCGSGAILLSLLYLRYVFPNQGNKVWKAFQERRRVWGLL